MKSKSKIIGNGELTQTLERSLEDYFSKLDGEPAINVYDMVINQIERTLLSDVLHRAKGNQTHAADMLGINRNTLRTKIKQYGIR